MATRKKRVPLISIVQFAAIVTATFALTLLVGFGYKVTAYNQIKQEATRLQQKLDRVITEHEMLKARKAYVQTDEYIEKAAREELHWGRYGDTMVSVKSISQVPPRPTLAPEDEPAIEPVGPQWRDWWLLFFGELPKEYGF